MSGEQNDAVYGIREWMTHDWLRLPGPTNLTQGRSGSSEEEVT